MLILGAVVTSLGTVLGLAVQIVTLLRFNKAQRREVSFSSEPVSKEQFAQHMADDKLAFGRIENQISDLSDTIQINKDEAEEGRARIYDKIDDVRQELSAKCDDIPSRVIADLANFKQFGAPK